MAIKTLEEAKSQVSNNIYSLAVGLFEELECSKLIHGNGHHMAQKLAAEAVKMVEERWNKDLGTASSTDATKPVIQHVAPPL